MRLADTRQGYGWVSIAFHWIVAIATFFLFFNGMMLEEGDDGDRERFAGAAGAAGAAGRQIGDAAGAAGRRIGDAASGLADGARQFGEGFANAGRQFAQNMFAARPLHISIGTLIILFIVARIVWRLWQGAQPKENESRALNLLAMVVQWAMLAALVVLAVTGPLLVWGMGQPMQVFNWFAIPSPLPAMRNLHETFEHAHTLAAYALVPLVGLHILGALKHALIDRDGVVRRMLVPTRA